MNQSPETTSSLGIWPALPNNSHLVILNSETNGIADDPSSRLIIELPAAGFKMIRRVCFCFGVVALLSCIPLVGVWYFLIYQNMMPGPVGDVPVAETSTAAGTAPAWYAWMVVISLAFISAIFIFAAFVYLLEAAHIMLGRTRFVISKAGIDLQRLIGGIHLRFGERFLEAEDIHRVKLCADRGVRPGSLRLTVEHQRPLDLAEEVPTADREWLAGVIRQAIEIS